MEDSNGDTDEQNDIPESIHFDEYTVAVMAGEPPDWFTQTDARIMMVLATGLTLTPSVIADNINSSRVTVSRRLNTLQAGGLVEKVDRGKYEITKEGQELASGDPERHLD